MKTRWVVFWCSWSAACSLCVSTDVCVYWRLALVMMMLMTMMTLLWVCVCVVGWTIIVALSTSDGSLTFSVQLGSHSQLIPLSLSLSVSLSVCLSLCLSVYVLLLVSYCVQMLVDLSFLCKFVNIWEWLASSAVSLITTTAVCYVQYMCHLCTCLSVLHVHSSVLCAYCT